jgi:hypothetical protein
MRVPEKETIYVNPDIYQGETGTSAIVNVPMNTPIVYGENPYLSTNESGQIVVNQPTPIITPNTSVGGVKNNLLDLEIEPITPTPSASTTPTPSTSTTTTPSTSTTTTPSASTTTTPSASITPTKKPNYILYGGILLAVIIAYKLLSSNKEN